MEVRLTGHAEMQIKYRELDRQLILQIALNPEQIIEEPDVPPIAQSRVTEDDKMYLIRIAFRDEGDIRLVITVYKTSKVSKYWREA
ncbi:MAG: DUF4258 domain-containing protein [Anaerolineae bacterium]|nr:DUF4258 domain-containing protein [Anaerolineae bacterium]